MYGSVEHFIHDKVGLPDNGIICTLLWDAGFRAADELGSMTAIADAFPYQVSRGNMPGGGDYCRF